MSTKLQNLYYRRQAGTPRSCYVCRSFTTTVLSTIKTDDFIFVCDKHLTDPGFATEVPDKTPSGPSAAEISKVIEEYKAKEAAKAAKEPGKDDKDKDKDAAEKKNTPSAPSTPNLPSVPAGSGTKKHKMYELHRSVFAMRVREHKQREQGAKAKEVGKGESVFSELRMKSENSDTEGIRCLC